MIDPVLYILSLRDMGLIVSYFPGGSLRFTPLATLIFSQREKAILAEEGAKRICRTAGAADSVISGTDLTNSLRINVLFVVHDFCRVLFSITYRYFLKQCKNLSRCYSAYAGLWKNITPLVSYLLNL